MEDTCGCGVLVLWPALSWCFAEPAQLASPSGPNPAYPTSRCELGFGFVSRDLTGWTPCELVGTLGGASQLYLVTV
jgi:hypothetical protein